MRLRMSENSLFAILLRSRWWASFAIAVGIATVSRALLPEALWPYGAFGGAPFLVISMLAARRQWKTPSAARVATIVALCEAMSRAEFVALLERALADSGHQVRQVDPGTLLAEKSGRRTVFGCARWKAATTGIEPIQALEALMGRHQAHDAVFVALGDIGHAARAHAVRAGIRTLGPADLAVLLRGRDLRAAHTVG